MGDVFPEIDSRNAAFIRKQHVYFVATAPLAEEGLVNLSPKGLESFAILGPKQVAYLDLIGSGIETVAHLRENGRIVIMFAAFEGPPRILRLHGRAEAVEPDDPRFDQLAANFPKYDGVRSVIVVDVHRISDSCGYGVPLYEYQGERTQMVAWAEKKGPEGLERYKAENNAESLDALPGLRGVHRGSEELS
ncbi:MAG: pyridoxamine 5'-phosphate oxidase family protein [Myxococcales bacterium]|nr:pyridoxamine 5'-phosphate oxidase family protein [Myxococcales bacterium]